jgi:BirA family biotin operon repressor/biotin-[acetyl-CoA-carboxylase] ligase
MTCLNPDVIRDSLDESVAGRLAAFETFEEIASTNSYLMDREAPSPGQFRVALTDNQVAGRGRHGRVWQSPAGSGLALSLAYTFAAQPANLAALTLAIGVGAIEALDRVGIGGVQLKWPNDLVADDGKLGGILTETQAQPDNAIKVVTGLGLNVELEPGIALKLASAGMGRVVDLAVIVDRLPCRNRLAAQLIASLGATFVGYESSGFSAYAGRWAQCDWLRGRELTVDTPQDRVAGFGAGIDEDGALLVSTASGDIRKVSSGTIVMTGRLGDSG